MEIQSGKSYISRGGQIFGPLEAEPRALENGGVWVWRTRHDGDWMHWTHSGKWYQDPTKESANDLLHETATDTNAFEEWRKSEAISARIKSYGDEPKAIEDRVGRATVDYMAEKAKEAAWAEKPPAAPMTKHRLLDLAKEATADRGLNYGKPEDNFQRIANRWNAHLVNKFGENPLTHRPDGVFLDATDVALMCADLKIARLENTPNHQDSWVDLAGYAACGAEIALASKDKSNG